MTGKKYVFAFSRYGCTCSRPSVITTPCYSHFVCDSTHRNKHDMQSHTVYSGYFSRGSIFMYFVGEPEDTKSLSTSVCALSYAHQCYQYGTKILKNTKKLPLENNVPTIRPVYLFQNWFTIIEVAGPTSKTHNMQTQSLTLAHHLYA